VKNLKQHLGQIHNGIMRLSAIGNIASIYLQEIPVLRPNVDMDDFIVMPNHIHCILDIGKHQQKEKRLNKYARPVSGSISVIINQFKGAVKKWCNKNGYEYFEWQPRFHDHIIRDERSYHRISSYIANNPVNWKEDRFYRPDLSTANPNSLRGTP
jgi:putative transposase